MKNFGKIVSLVLLLATLVSVLAVFPAFAADTSETTGVVVHKTNYGTVAPANVGNSTTAVIATQVDKDGNVVTDESGNAVIFKYDEKDDTTLQKSVALKDVNGKTYYHLGYNNLPEDIYVKYATSPYYQLGKTNADLYFADQTYVNKKGNSVSITKSCDFFVIDFDYSVNNMTVGGMFRVQTQFYCYYYNNAGKEISMQNGHIEIRRVSDHSVEIFNSGDGKKLCTIDTSGGEWNNLTLIYDTRDTATGAQVHVYSNGTFVGSATVSSTYNKYDAPQHRFEIATPRARLRSPQAPRL